MSDPIIEQLDEQLRLVADAETALRMRAYMRDRFEFLGVKTPERRARSKPLVTASRQRPIDEMRSLVDELRSKDHREFHYIAGDVLRANANRLGPDHLADLQRWITRDPWWDTVDAIASPTVGVVVLNHPTSITVMDDWVDSDNIWLARTAIIHQLRFKERTDTSRLFDYAVARSADDDFFIRKAIGWALRQYGRTDPDAVRTFVDQHRDRLSPLSIREATKHLL